MLHCPGFHFAQLDNGKAEVVTTSPKLALILVGLPVGLGVTQDGQADNISWMFVEDPVIVNVHALREIGVDLRLDFDVQDHPGVQTVLPHKADEGIGVAAVLASISCESGQFLVENLVAKGPIHLGMDVGKTQFQKVLKMQVDGLFPGRVEIAALFFPHRWPPEFLLS